LGVFIVNKAGFYRNLDELLEVDQGTIKGSDLLADLENWDSVAVISFIAMADEKYGVNIPAKRIAGCQSVDDLAAILAELQAVSK
jgi:acyl carrier protein